MDTSSAITWLPSARTTRSRGMSRRARGEGQIRRRADGRWEGRFTTPDGRRRSVFALTKDDDAKQLRNATIARDRGTLASPNAETMRAYLRTWLAGAQPSLRPMTFQSYSMVDGRLHTATVTVYCPPYVNEWEDYEPTVVERSEAERAVLL
jgi:hypothetical protein